MKVTKKKEEKVITEGFRRQRVTRCVSLLLPLVEQSAQMRSRLPVHPYPTALSPLSGFARLTRVIYGFFLALALLSCGAVLLTSRRPAT